jgi:autotransporter passenger strand-loop-strand repeat protein
VLSGGAEADYGWASGTVVLSGGQELVQDHGIASASKIRFGGTETVASGGVAVAATISGGTLVVSSGGALSGGLTIQGGRAIVSGAVAAGQTVTFTGAGVLELDNLAGFHAVISGLTTSSQKVDLGGFAYSSSETATWTQAGTSGTLSVVDGAKVATLTLIGTYATSNFQLAADGHGGTFLFDPPPPEQATAAPAATRFAQALAGFGGGRSGAGFAAVHAGGTERGDASVWAAATISGH